MSTYSVFPNYKPAIRRECGFWTADTGLDILYETDLKELMSKMRVHHIWQTDDDYVEFTLPTHWLSALFNGDYSGLTTEETIGLTRFLSDNQREHRNFWAVGTAGDENPTFEKYHDARDYNVLGCECCTVVFSVY